MSIKQEIGARCIFTNGHESVSPEVEGTGSFNPSRGMEYQFLIICDDGGPPTPEVAFTEGDSKEQALASLLAYYDDNKISDMHDIISCADGVFCFHTSELRKEKGARSELRIQKIEQERKLYQEELARKEYERLRKKFEKG